MSVPITDKADNLSTLVDNTNILTEIINEQLDSSVLANLTTQAKKTLVAAINELNKNKIGSNGDTHIDGHMFAKSFNAKEFHIGADEYNNTILYFLDVKTNNEVQLKWNSGKQKWQITYPGGQAYDLLTGESFDFDSNESTHLIMKMLNEGELQTYIGPKGELVVNESNFSDIRIQNGITPGGNSITGKGGVKIRRID